MRYLVRNNLMEPLMTVFFENGARYNLLNSAVLELVEFVRKENIKVRLGCSGGARFGEGGGVGSRQRGCSAASSTAEFKQTLIAPRHPHTTTITRS